MKQDQFVLIGEKKSLNLGDSVICRIAEYLFHRTFPLQNIVLYDISIAKRPETWIGYKLKKLCSIIKIPNLFLYGYTFSYYFPKIRRNAHVYLVGGALLQDFFSVALVAVINLCRLKHAHLHFSGVGLGPLCIDNEKILKKALSHLPNLDIKLRDGIEYFSNNIYSNCTMVPDIALCCPYVYGDINKGNYIGWGIITPKMYSLSHNNIPLSESYYIDECKRAITSLCKDGETIAIFTNGDIDDYIIACQVYESFRDCENVILLERPTSDLDLVNSYRRFKAVISSRLHSIIIAFSYSIPSIALSWDNKVNEFVQVSECSSAIYDISEMHHINWVTELRNLRRFNTSKKRLQELQKIILDNISNNP